MKILITNATVCDPQSAFNGKKCDLLIRNGIIEDILLSGKKSPEASAKNFDAKNIFISPGWFDMRAALREPGFEFKEDLVTAAAAAAAGGFTGLACLPTTFPPIQTKADIEFIRNKSENLPVHIFPLGAISKNLEGKEMNELFDMHLAGAVGFTDGNKTIADAGLMLRVLMYTKVFGSRIFAHCEDPNISAGGRMHEGGMSTSLGMKGITPIAEEIIIHRDIELAKYVSAPIHISHISSKGSVEIIRKAKKQGVPVTCDVAVANLVFTDESLKKFDSNYKLTPPLRSKSDRKALWDGLIDGTIDCIVSDHHPEDTEHKDVEFEYAAYGMIQLQTAYSLLNMNAPKNFSDKDLIRCLSVNPRKILNIEPVKIEKGGRAELTLFDKKRNWKYESKNNCSRSANSPLLNTELKGMAVAILSKDQFIKNL
ncbi:MAG: dihydroorotase family protein [Bacteroidia bacterium]